MCKFLQGADDTKLEAKLKKLFHKVHRDKPDSSRKVCPSCRVFGDNLTDGTKGISGAILCGT